MTNLLKRTLLTILTFTALTSLAGAEDSLGAEIQAVLKTCSPEWSVTLEEMKESLVESSIWNYDNDYDVESVSISPPYKITETSFFINVFFDVEGLKELGYEFQVKPLFETSGECAYIETLWEQM